MWLEDRETGRGDRRGGDRRRQEPAYVQHHRPWEVVVNSAEGMWEAVRGQNGRRVRMGAGGPIRRLVKPRRGEVVAAIERSGQI